MDVGASRQVPANGRYMVNRNGIAKCELSDRLSGRPAYVEPLFLYVLQFTRTAFVIAHDQGAERGRVRRSLGLNE